MTRQNESSTQRKNPSSRGAGFSAARSLTDRDQDVVRAVGRFRQLSSAQIRGMAFVSVSQTPVDRCLRRLAESGYLRRLPRRLGGDAVKGGAGAAVYQLGPSGWSWLGQDGRYWPHRGLDLHALAVADTYLEVLAAERAGAVAILGCELEKPVTPDVRADLDLTVGLVGRGIKRRFFIEADLGSERRKVIEDKARAYLDAWTRSTDTFPYVVFAVPDEWRKVEIERVIQGLEDGQELFRVTPFGELMDVIMAVDK